MRSLWKKNREKLLKSTMICEFSFILVLIEEGQHLRGLPGQTIFKRNINKTIKREQRAIEEENQA